MHSTQASTTSCRRCRAPILNGWDDGLLARVDPLAVDQVVAAALLQLDPPVPIYEFSPGRWLYQRNIDQIGGPLRGTLHAAHDCRRPARVGHKNERGPNSGGIT